MGGGDSEILRSARHDSKDVSLASIMAGSTAAPTAWQAEPLPVARLAQSHLRGLITRGELWYTLISAKAQ
jgi:hypothetical protein